MTHHYDLTRTAAIILAGGRSRRLQGIPKAEVSVDGVSLLERTLAATSALSRSVVVGPDPGWRRPRMVSVRESPPFAGPAAAIQTGLNALSPHTQRVLVLACDYVRPEELVRRLLRCPPNGDATVLIDEQGRNQWLAALYSRNALADAFTNRNLQDRSVAGTLSTLVVEYVQASPGSCADIDTHDDLRDAGAELPDTSGDQLASLPGAVLIAHTSPTGALR